jgi:hypothetical protein
MMFASVVCSATPARADDIVLRWNEIATRTATATTPFNQARVTAIVQLAVFEALNAVTGEYEPYLNPATTAPVGTSADAAAITAAHRVLTTYFPAPAVVAALNSARDSDLAAIPNGAAKSAGITVGVGSAVRCNRLLDRSPISELAHPADAHRDRPRDSTFGPVPKR